MSSKLKNYGEMRNEKGQGLTEYVLLLAFIAAIAFMLNSGGLLGTVKGSYNESQGIFAMLFGDNSRPDWGHADVSTFNESNSAERLARDQEALVNLANFFMGKTKAEVKAILSVPGHKEGYSADVAWNGGEDVVLGRIYRNDDGGTEFNSLAINENYSPYIYNWMQGDYGTNGSYNLSYDATNKYLVSDYALENGWTGTSDGGTWDNGIHLRLQYDNEKKVIGARVTIDPSRQGSTIGEGSSGLEVTVKKDGTSEVTNTKNSVNF